MGAYGGSLPGNVQQQLPTNQMAGGGTGGGLDILRQLIAIKGLSDLKNISKYSSAFDLVSKLSPEANLTTEQKNRAAAVQPASLIVKTLQTEDIPDLGLLGSYGAKFSLSKLGGRYLPEKVQSLNSKYEILRQNVVRALQGAKMSDVDIKIAAGYVPTIVDTPQNAKVKLRNLDQMLTAISNGTYQGTGNINSVVPQGMTNKPPLESFIR